MSTKKIILFSILGIVLLFGGYVAYIIATTKNHSPAGTASLSQGGLDVSLTYSRPFKKGRLVFGPEAEGALQPYGKYWRLGANEATEITFSKAVKFAGKPVAAGQYVIYAVPGESTWTFGLNTELGRWGYAEVDHGKDVLTVEVPSTTLPEIVEQLTLDFTGQDSVLFLNMKWDQTHVAVPIEAGE
ncbi:MAG: DUF2911 domain-containing protein [Bacteroidia bacterium]|nr:DUF2911 domain-containing protein [Bacteroidia bacterium]